MVTRGVVITLSQDLLNHIIAEALGFNQGEIDVLHMTNTYHNRAVELTIRAAHDDERFPIVLEGMRYPDAYPEICRNEDGSLKVNKIHVFDNKQEGI